MRTENLYVCFQTEKLKTENFSIALLYFNLNFKSLNLKQLFEVSGVSRNSVSFCFLYMDHFRIRSIKNAINNLQENTHTIDQFGHYSSQSFSHHFLPFQKLVEGSF